MKYYIVVDLEWMSWKNNYYGRFLEKEKRKSWQKKEIIQIGAIKFDKNFKIIKKLNIYVKPKINPKLSKYIIKLTSIFLYSLLLINFLSTYLSKSNICVIFSL